MTTFTVTLQPTLGLSDAQFEQISRDNRDPDLVEYHAKFGCPLM